jgi:hypothetical protein
MLLHPFFDEYEASLGRYVGFEWQWSCHAIILTERACPSEAHVSLFDG